MILDEAISKFGGVSILPQVATATVTGSAVDVNGGASATIFAFCGAYAGSAVKFSLVESDTEAGTFTDVTEDGIIGPVDSIASTDSVAKVIGFGYKGYKRFIKVKATFTGTSGTAIAAAVILGTARHVPTDAFLN